MFCANVNLPRCCNDLGAEIQIYFLKLICKTKRIYLSAPEHMRYRRSPQEPLPLRREGPPAPYAPAPSYAEDLPVSASASYGKGHKGRVGPVYTFVKTDPKANFKWGVRHIVGSQYGK